MPRTNLPWRPSKRGLCRRVGKGQSSPPEGHARRDLVSGRSAYRPEEQDHKALGPTRDQAFGAKGTAAEIGLRLWRDLHRTRQGRGACSGLCHNRNPCPATKGGEMGKEEDGRG